ncbi:MAG: heme-binding protein [Gammaproteobacteria bacterium]
MKHLATLSAALVGLTFLSTPRAELPSKPVLDLATAKQIIAAARGSALQHAATVVIAVVDDGGYPLVIERLDGTQVASVAVAMAKAKTAAIFRRPSKDFEDQVRQGRVAAISLPGATPLQGGLPLVVDNYTVGAIGVSENSPQQDEDIAHSGVVALETLQRAEVEPVTILPAAEVVAAFAKGQPLIETPGYKIHASRRDGPGSGEVHRHETDVIHVLEGNATLVTGGRLIDPKETTPGELRAGAIEGGEAREIGPGDVIVVPAGTPHWFRSATSPFLYFVVKPVS